MKEKIRQNRKGPRVFSIILLALVAVAAGCATSGVSESEQAAAEGSSRTALEQPREIPENATCGKCGMYPARYPRWHSQIIFKDNTMVPFDGCKCMFNFLFAMDKYDRTHSVDDVAVAWVKDFNSSAWINAEDAYYVVGSNMMGPMGKELIPFADRAAALKFQDEQAGAVMRYGDISPAVLGTLGMGNMRKHMKM